MKDKIIFIIVKTVTAAYNLVKDEIAKTKMVKFREIIAASHVNYVKKNKRKEEEFSGRAKDEIEVVKGVNKFCDKMMIPKVLQPIKPPTSQKERGPQEKALYAKL